ncbi:MAG: hypothetical protein WC551_00245 [Patescibacteria group bacterium]
MKKITSLLVLSLMFAFVGRAHAQDSANSVRDAYAHHCRYGFQVETESSDLDILGYDQGYHDVRGPKCRVHGSPLGTMMRKPMRLRMSGFLTNGPFFGLEYGYVIPSPWMARPFWLIPLWLRQSRCSENVFVLGGDGCGYPPPYIGPPPMMPRRDSGVIFGGLGFHGNTFLY